MTNEEIKKRIANVAKSSTFSNILRTYDLGNKKVLDIGCSYGEFLVKFGSGSMGVTVNDREVEWGKTNNVNIQLGNIEESFDTEEKFDSIFANNIFEHMLAPHLFLIKIKRFLKEDGLLILGVPCVPYAFPLVVFKKFNGFKSPAHVNFFNKYTLGKTVEYAGWTVVENRGFVFRNKFLDMFVDLICPHFYVVAKINKSFKYDDKRLVELSGYKEIYKI